MSPIESIESSLYGIKKIPEHISIHPIYEEQFMNELNTLIWIPRSWKTIIEYYSQQLFRNTEDNSEQEKEKRAKRIQHINQLQQAFLIQQKPAWREIIEAMDLNQRTLVLYDRGKEQWMCQFSMILITKILEIYIQKYSSVYNKIAIVPRYLWYAPDYLASNSTIVHNEAMGEEFQQISHIYADTIHFTDGNPDFWYGNIPILWLATTENLKRQKQLIWQEFETTHIFFGREREKNKQLEWNSEILNKNVIPRGIWHMLSEIIRSIHEVEIKHIQNIWKYPITQTQWNVHYILV